MSDTEKYLITYIKKSSTSSLEVSTINNVEIIPELCFNIQLNDILHFFKYIPTFIKRNVKALVLQLFDFEHPNFENNVQFRFMIANELKKRRIKFYFIHFNTLQLTTLIVAANLETKVDESVLIIKVSSTNDVIVHELLRTVDGYKCPLIKGKRVVECKPGYKLNAVKDDILANTNPKKIILVSCTKTPSELFKDLKNNILKSKKLIAFENLDINFHYRAIFEIAERICNERYNKYFIYPDNFYGSFFVENEEELGQYSNEIYLSWNRRDECDMRQTELAPRSHKPYYVGYSPFDENEKCCIIKHLEVLKGEYHRIKLSLNVDINFLPTVFQFRHIDPKIEQLPNILTEKMDSKIPVIGFFDNSSVICFWNESEKCYKFSEKWNGLYGKYLFIAFDKEKPTFFDEARETLKTHPTFVVFDLIKVMAGDIYHPPKDWKFDIKHNEDTSYIIVFDSYDGERIGAKPEILMGRLLWEHIKVIKRETKIEPKELGFIFVDKNDSRKYLSYPILEEKMKKVCEMLGIGCNIIDM